MNTLSKLGKLRNKVQSCCIKEPSFKIIYQLGTKWLVCKDCIELEEFSSDIKKKTRINENL